MSLLININSLVSYATGINIKEFVQVDLKNNIHEGYYGDIEHYTKMIDYIVLNDGTIMTYVTVKDDIYYSNYIMKYSKDGKLISKEKITSVTIDGKFIMEDNKLILITIEKYGKQRFPMIHFFNKYGNKVYTFVSRNNFEKIEIDSSKMVVKDKTLIILKNNDRYLLIEAENNFFELLEDDDEEKNNLSVKEKIINPSYSDEACEVYIDLNNDLWIKYKNRKNYCFFYKGDDFNTTMAFQNASQNTIWIDKTKPITQVKFLMDNNILLESNSESYIYDIERKKLIKCEEAQNNIIKVNEKTSDSYLELKNKKINYYDNYYFTIHDDNQNNIDNCIATYNQDDEVIDYLMLEDTLDESIFEIEPCKQENIVFSIENENQIIYIDKNGKIYTYKYLEKIDEKNENTKVAFFDENNMVLFNDKNNFIGSYFLISSLMPLIDIKIDCVNNQKIDSSDLNDVIYSGLNDLEIEGEIKDLKYGKYELTCSLGDMFKTIEIDLSQSNRFKFIFDKNELTEGYYDDLSFTFKCKDEIFKTKKYFDEIELGTRVNYDNVFYTKISSDTLIEEYPENNTAITKKYFEQKSEDVRKNYLSQEDFEKTKEYIKFEPNYIFGLRENVYAANGEVLLYVGKDSGIYERNIKTINLNEEFYFNTLDGSYYNYVIETDNVIKTNMKILVSHQAVNKPTIEITPNMQKYINEDAKIKIYMNNVNYENKDTLNLKVEKLNLEEATKENVKNEEVLIENENVEFLEDLKKYKIYEMQISENGYYEVSAYTKDKFGNESIQDKKIVKIDKIKPVIEDIKYLNLFKDKNGKFWTCYDTAKVSVSIREDSELLVKNFDEQKNNKNLELIKKSLSNYELIINLESGEKIELELIDEAGNITFLELEVTYKKDNIKPLIEDVNIKYSDENAKINITANDNESGIKNIYYKIMNYENILELSDIENMILCFESENKEKNENSYLESYEKYNNQITLNREKYDRNTYICSFAIDCAGNTSFLNIHNVNLNSKVDFKISEFSDIDSDENILNDSEIIKFDLSRLSKFNIKILDDDLIDKHTVKIRIDDILLYEKILTKDEREILLNLNDFKKIINNLEYEQKIIMTIEISDDETNKIQTLYLIKENMIPRAKIVTNKLGFENYLECVIDINDFDTAPYNNSYLKIINKSLDIDESIFEGNLYSGKNKIILTRGIQEGSNNLQFNIYNYQDKITISKKVEVQSKIELFDNEILLINIDEKYDLRFIEMLNQLVSESVKNSIVVLSMNCNLKNEYDELLNDYNVYDYNSVIKNITKIKEEKFFILISDDAKEDCLKLKTLFENDLINLYEVGKELKIQDIEFVDCEKDYYAENRGKNRNLKMIYDPLNFENAKNKYEIKTYDSVNNTLGSLRENENIENKEIKFQNNEVSIFINDAGKYEVVINEEDHIIYNDIDYSKSSNNEKYMFYAHNKPYVNLKYEEIENNNEIMTIKISKIAYDKDFISINSGIKKTELIIKRYDQKNNLIFEDVKEVEFELEKLNLREEKENTDEYENYQKNVCTQMFEDIILDVNKNERLEINFKVWDFGIELEENQYEFSNEDNISIVKNNNIPNAFFDYYLEQKNNQRVFAENYVYVLDYCENLNIEEDIEYNDFYATDGVRTKTYTFSENEIKNEIVKTNFFEDKVNRKILFNDLKVVNKHNNSCEHNDVKLEVLKLDVYNNTILDDKYLKDNAFKTDTDIKVQIEVKNLKKDNDVYLIMNNKKMNNMGKGKFETIITSLELEEFIKDKELENENFENIQYEYEVKIYSSRDDSLLGIRTYSFNIMNPVEILDFTITQIYDQSYKGYTPVSYMDMPVLKIKKGYAFDFEIITKGLSEENDMILITPRYYFLDENEVKKVKLFKLKDGKREKVQTLIMKDNKVLGNLEYLILSREQKNENEGIQIWNGRFFVPPDAYPVIEDNLDMSLVKNGEILVNFEIKAYREKSEIYNFNVKKWRKVNNSKYNLSGDVIIYDNTKNAINDYNGFDMY